MKQVTFNDIYTLEVDLIKEEGGDFHIVLVYGFEDSEGNKWPAKRTTLKKGDIPPIYQTKVLEIINAAEIKVKQLEKI